MCEMNGTCRKLENLKDKPEECSEEQIRKCHGDAAGHPCTSDRNNQE